MSARECELQLEIDMRMLFNGLIFFLSLYVLCQSSLFDKHSFCSEVKTDKSLAMLEIVLIQTGMVNR